MPVVDLRAAPHPEGHRIDLSWSLPEEWPFDSVRVVRRSGTYPVSPDDGNVVVEVAADAAQVCSDVDLRADEFHYYALFPGSGTPPSYELDAKNRAMALATAPQGYPALFKKLLPDIYHRYDRETGVLDRLLTLWGGELDVTHSYTSVLPKLQDVGTTAGPLLPLLAQTIGWKLDNQLELDEQRDAVRRAPAIYQTIGLLPTVEASVKRLSGWESRSKEYFHQIFASNRPERLNLWSLRASGTSFDGEETLLSLDDSFDGGASSALDAHGVRWLFYHTRRRRRVEIWYKTAPSFRLPTAALDELSPGPVSRELLELAAGAGLTLSQAATLAVEGSGFRITDGGESYFAEAQGDEVWVVHTSADLAAFAASAPLVVNAELQKLPSAALHAGELWLFWQEMDAQTGEWSVRFKRRSGGAWSAVAPDATPLDHPFLSSGTFDASRPRRRPVAAAESNDRLWLFWLERHEGAWRIAYNRRIAGAWGEPQLVPSEAGAPLTRDDLAAVIDATNGRVHLFWSEPAPSSNGSLRMQVRQRVKQNLLLDTSGFGSSGPLPKAASDNHHDREPHARLETGVPIVYFSSNRDDAGYSIWRSALTSFATNTWAPPERLTGGAYSERSPLIVASGTERLLVYRSNRHRVHQSAVYRASEIRDERYAGSIALDTRHAQKIEQLRGFFDSERYTYDTGALGVRDDADRIARDTVGLFLETDTLNDAAVANGIARLRPALQEFVPATDRVVFVPTKDLHTEFLYSYNRPLASDARFIVESVADEFVTLVSEPAFAEGEDFDDALT